MIMKKRKRATLIEVQTLRLPKRFSNNCLSYTYVQMSKIQGSACNTPRDIFCAKFVKVHKVMLNAKYHSAMPFGFKHNDF